MSEGYKRAGRFGRKRLRVGHAPSRTPPRSPCAPAPPPAPRSRARRARPPARPAPSPVPPPPPQPGRPGQARWPRRPPAWAGPPRRVRACAARAGAAGRRSGAGGAQRAPQARNRQRRICFFTAAGRRACSAMSSPADTARAVVRRGAAAARRRASARQAGPAKGDRPAGATSKGRKAAARATGRVAYAAGRGATALRAREARAGPAAGPATRSEACIAGIAISTARDPAAAPLCARAALGSAAATRRERGHRWRAVPAWQCELVQPETPQRRRKCSLCAACVYIYKARQLTITACRSIRARRLSWPSRRRP